MVKFEPIDGYFLTSSNMEFFLDIKDRNNYLEIYFILRNRVSECHEFVNEG